LIGYLRVPRVTNTGPRQSADLSAEMER